MKELLLQLKKVSVHYGGVQALTEVSLAIDEGEIVALIGPNGAGKSSVLKAIFGLAPIASGEIFWHGAPIHPSPHKQVERGVAFVPQGRRVFGSLTVRENLEMGGIIIRDSQLLEERIAQALDLFPDLKPKLNDKSRALSGGQQQMTALARGLITDPKVLLLDEPSLGLAPKIVHQVFEKIVEINERRKTAIMIVEHNIKTALALATRVYVLNIGKIVAQGSGEKIMNSKLLEHVFLGKIA